MLEHNEKTLPTLEVLQEEARNFIYGRSVVPEHATLITLSGELGAGKTSFAQGVAKALGITDPITSPTFVLQKTYPIENSSIGFTTLVHIDAYRLEGDHSLTPLEFLEQYKDPHTVILLEWPEKVHSQLPSPDVAIHLSVLPENTRGISYIYG